MTKPTHTCAVCPKPIAGAYLMCFAHWRLVPKQQANELMRAYGALERSGKYPARMRLEILSKYRQARESVIATVQAQINEVDPT